MQADINRRELLKLVAAGGAAYLGADNILTFAARPEAGKPAVRLAGKLISPGCRRSKVKVAKIYMGIPQSHYPNPGLDLKKEVQLYESEFAKLKDELADVEFVVGELIREKVLQLVHQEVPHSIAVVVEEFKERPNNIIYILATIYVEHDSQKGIIIGNNGQMLKKIGQLAREDIEGLLGCKVYLELYAKVRKNWRKNINDLKEFGYY